MSQPNDTPVPGGSDRTGDEPTQPANTEQTNTEQTNTEQTEDTRVIQTDHPETGSQPTEQLPADPGPADPGPADPAPADPAPTEFAVAGRPSGPHLPAILLGLACLVIAGLAMAQELGHLQIDWGNVGPLGIVAAGAVLVVLGLVGLLTARRRDTN
jgi:hypothetical protein